MIFDSELLLNLQKIALHNVTSDTFSFFLHKCYKYYSKTYHTPLHLVKQQLSPIDVMIIFLEDHYEQMSAEDRNRLKKELLAIQQPVIPETAAETLNSIDEEAEEDYLVQSLIDKLAKEKEEAENKQKNSENKQQVTDQSGESSKDLSASSQGGQEIQIPPLENVKEESIQFDIEE